MMGFALLAAATLNAQEIKGRFGGYDGSKIDINIGSCDREVLKISADGSFEFHPVIRYEGQKFTINMPDGTRIPVLVGEGQTAVVETSVENGRTAAKLSGDRDRINTYLFAEANLLGGKLWTKDKEYASFAEFSEDVDRLDKQLDKLLDRIKGDRNYIDTYRVEKEVDILGYKLGYGRMAENANLDPDYVVFMNGIDVNNLRMLREDTRGGSLGYPGLVQRRLAWEEKLTRTPQDDPRKSAIRELKLLDKLVTEPEIRNALSYYLAVSYFLLGGNEHGREFA